MSNEYETWKAYAENLQAQRENDAETMQELTHRLEEAESMISRSVHLSVTNILLDVVPGNGDGHEVYATSVEQVESRLSDYGQRIEELEEELAIVSRERDHFRAVLEGARYPNLDNLKDRPYAQCRQIGETVAEITKALIADFKDYQARLATTERLLRSCRYEVEFADLKRDIDLYFIELEER